MAFLVFEGIDGAGKSSLMNGLETYLMRQSIKSIVTREPGGTPLGEELREILIRTSGASPLPRAEALLYQVIRAQHVEERIKPSLDKGLWVLCDRYAASSIAFQAGGRNILDKEIQWLNEFSTQNLQPDLYILLDLDIHTAKKRMEKRYSENNGKKDRFELEKEDFHARVREKYLELARLEPKRWLILDATKATDTMLQDVIQCLQEKQCL